MGGERDFPPFTVYCDMDPNDPGWTEIPYAEDLPLQTSRVEMDGDGYPMILRSHLVMTK